MSAGWPSQASTDHPRSRGVYAIAAALGGGCDGSSPLARGLRRRPCLAAVTAVDHPRSRGVYWINGEQQDIAVGSSPLARGLPTIAGHEIAVSGIIPARAGFTRPGRPGREPGADHPRSRGVYVGARAGMASP